MLMTDDEKFGASAAVDPAMPTKADTLRSKHAQAGMAMAAATFAMAAASGIQAALYLHSFGIDGRTDGFFVAFALYTVFGVFSQSIRVTSAPLLVGGGDGLSVREFAATLALIAVPVALITGPLAHPLALALAPGLSDANRSVTQDALPILGGAMILQLWAAGGATVLAVRDRFTRIAGAYMVGAGAGLVAYIVVSGPAGPLSLAGRCWPWPSSPARSCCSGCARAASARRPATGARGPRCWCATPRRSSGAPRSTSPSTRCT